MKIAVTAAGQTLEAPVDPRLGRCRYILLIDPETMSFEVHDNVDAMASGGAGVAVAQMLAGKGVRAVLTGNCGPNAYQVLSAAGIQVMTGVTGVVRDVVQRYRSGELKASPQPTVPGHFGLGGGGGRGRGRGMGWGGGRGAER
jgi:predicted Fe-Mo cluster-binding NifX family protein